MKTYVNNASGVLKKVLLCPPTYFEFEPINVITEKWLDKGEASNKEACMKEHLEFQQAVSKKATSPVNSASHAVPVNFPNTKRK